MVRCSVGFGIHLGRVSLIEASEQTIPSQRKELGETKRDVRPQNEVKRDAFSLRLTHFISFMIYCVRSEGVQCKDQQTFSRSLGRERKDFTHLDRTD